MPSKKKKDVALALIASALLAAVSGPLVGQDKSKGANPPFIYPVVAKSTWEYRVDTKKVTTRVARVEVAEKEMRVILESSDGSKPVSEKLLVREDGVFREATAGQAVTPPLCILKLPPRNGDSWRVQSMSASQSITGTFAASEEVVTVPAGTYKAVKVTSNDFSIGNVRMPTTCWYVSGVGLVKQSIAVEGRGVTLELEKYTPGKLDQPPSKK